MDSGVMQVEKAIREEEEIDPEEESPIEEVRLTVSNYDDPTLPVYTFRMWFLGLISCTLLSFVNTFFSFRAQPLSVDMVAAMVVTLPIGRFMAKVLPATQFRLPFCGDRKFSLNPGPFNMKEHAMISLFASLGSGAAYAVDIVTIIIAFYRRNISFIASWILIITTQILGYSWAGMMRKYVVEPAEMWWPGSLVQVSLFSALHENETKRMTRAKFFVIVMICGFCWYTFPGYLMFSLSSLSVLCWIFSKSPKAQLIGSGLQGLGILSFTLDWSIVASYLGSPNVSPFFTIVNVSAGYFLLVYGLIPLAYWGLDLYDARKFPMFSSQLFDSRGQKYNVEAILNDNFEIDLPTYEKLGQIKLSTSFVLAYCLNFAAVAASLSHVVMFYGKEIINTFRASNKGKMDIHTKLMRKYPDIPIWWSIATLIVSLGLALFLCIFMKDQVQFPWWGLILSLLVALTFTLPISIITATTNMTPGINVITEYIFGLVNPGKPIANTCFKTYGYISMVQAVSFLSEFKFGHYMKIPPRSMFLVQMIGTVVAGTINAIVAFWQLKGIDNICHPDLLPDGSPWTCNGYGVFYDASVIWGLIGPMRIFGALGDYGALNWGFLVGAIGPVLVYALHRAFPSQKWIKLINLPVLFSATGMLPPASTINFNSWIVMGTFFNFFIFRYRKKWWQRYNYVLSAALGAGLAFMGVLLFLTIGDLSISWWGNDSFRSEHCDLARCPSAKGVDVPGCPVP